MRVCDRCRCPDPMYTNVYIGGRVHDICANCHKEYDELTNVFESIEKDFMKNKTLKHIDFQWEDAR